MRLGIQMGGDGGNIDWDGHTWNVLVGVRIIVSSISISIEGTSCFIDHHKGMIEESLETVEALDKLE